MSFVHQISSYSPINMAKRQKTEETGNINDQTPGLPLEPSDVVKAISLAVNRRPDINEYRCDVGTDISSFPSISPPISDSECTPSSSSSHRKNKKKKKSKTEGCDKGKNDTGNANKDTSKQSTVMGAT